MSRSRRIVVALFAVLGVGVAVCAGLVWESFQPIVIELPAFVEGLALSADGASVAACGSDLDWIYTTEAGFRPVEHTGPYWPSDQWSPAQLVFSDQERLVVAMSQMRSVRAWSRRDGSHVPLARLGLDESFHAEKLSPAGDLVAGLGWTHEIQLWSLPEVKLVGKIPTNDWLTASSYGVGFSPSGRLLHVCRGGFRPRDGKPDLRVWNVRAGMLVSEGASDDDVVAALEADDLALESSRPELAVVEVRTRRERWRVTLPHDVEVHVISRDGERFADAGSVVEVRDMADGHVVDRFQVHESPRCTAIAFSANRERLAAAFGRRIYVWRLRR